MPNEDTLSQQMDEAANGAKGELQGQFDRWSARDVAAWWAKWYLKAGHKRLGRILIAMGKQTK